MSQDGPQAKILDSVEEHTRMIGTGHENTYYFVHVKKGKGEGEVEVKDPLYKLSLDRTKGTRLGIKLDVQVATRSLFIKEVTGGLAFQWNTQHQDNKIRPGDRILKVNNVEGDAHKLFEECKKTVPLELELHRGSAIPVTAGFSVIVTTAFGNLKEGQQGTIQKVDEEGDALIKIVGTGHVWVCKQDYNKLTFEDSERYVLKRYCDFKDLYTTLYQKLSTDDDAPIKALPEFPKEEHFGFRRHLSALGMSSFMQVRKEGLQTFIDGMLEQVPKLDTEPVVGEFFGANPIPDVPAAAKEILKQRMDMLMTKHRQIDSP